MEVKKFGQTVEGVVFLQGSGFRQKVETGSRIKNDGMEKATSAIPAVAFIPNRRGIMAGLSTVRDAPDGLNVTLKAATS